MPLLYRTFSIQELTETTPTPQRYHIDATTQSERLNLPAKQMNGHKPSLCPDKPVCKPAGRVVPDVCTCVCLHVCVCVCVCVMFPRLGGEERVGGIK